MRPIIRIFLALPLLTGAGYGLYHAARLARAERLAARDTVQSLEAASGLSSENAEYYARVAVLDASRDDELAAALARSSREPSLWILRSVRQEQDGDLAGAEQSLLHANEICRYYIPRWSLAAFYYRRQDRARFQEWARAALSVGLGDPESLVRMAQKLGLSPDEILRSVVPDDPQRLEQYIYLALRDPDPAAAQPAALRLLGAHAQARVEPVLDTCDALFRAGRISDAAELWNRAIAAHKLNFAPIDPGAGKSLAAAGFLAPSLGRGFDWRYANVDGVARSISDRDGSLNLEFSGNQPERCDLASQHVELRPGSEYRATVRYRVDGIAPGAGLRLAIGPLTGGAPVLSGLLNLPAADYADQSFEFQAPPEPAPFELVLAYGRMPGTTRIEGRLWIQSIRLEPISRKGSE